VGPPGLKLEDIINIQTTSKTLSNKGFVSNSNSLTPHFVLEDINLLHIFTTGITTGYKMRQAKHFFNLESKANKNGERLIIFNLSYGFKTTNSKNKLVYKPVRLSTQRTILENDWDESPRYRANRNYVSRKGKDLNNILEKIENAGYSQLSYYREQNSCDPSPEELKKMILEKLDRLEKIGTETSLVDYINKVIKRRTSLPVGSTEHWADATANVYQVLISHIEKYQTKTQCILTFEKMTEEIYWDYFKVINEIRFEEEEKYYTQTAMSKDCKHLKVIFKDADDSDIPIGFNYNKKGLKINDASASYETFLSTDQLKKLIETDVSHTIAFQHAKKYAIISSFCGLRIGDMMHIHEITPEIVNYQGQELYCFTTRVRKGKKKGTNEDLIVTIPILKPIKDLLESNGGMFPKFPSEPVIRRYIKRLLKFLEFDEQVKIKHSYYLQTEPKIEYKPQHEMFQAHDFRRTFITNLKELNLHNEEIEPITHPKVKYQSIVDLYDKSPLIVKAIRLKTELNNKNSLFYCC
jgi:hypothetical protein